jgi:glycosyltransferase involved in cell wall biosynthesis
LKTAITSKKRISAPVKCAVFLSHPIQYFYPIWRQLAKDHSLDLTVFYLSDSSVRGDVDPGFGRKVKWDVPLLEGYKSVFLKPDAHPENRWSLTIPSLTALLKEGGFQCVVIPGYSRPFEWQILWTAKRLGIKIVMRGEFAPSARQNRFKNLIRKQVLKAIYRRVDAFAVIGIEARTHLEEHGVRPENLFSSPYCVDSVLFSQKANPAKVSSLRKKMGLKPKDKVVLFSGKLIPRKRPDTLIKAIAQLSDLPKVKAVLVGDGELMTSLRQLADQLAPGRIFFPGFINQTQLSEYFGLAGALVLPSEYETWGLVINEAMHQGLPVFATNKVGCVKDIVLPGCTGEVFETGDFKTLAEYLRRLWTKPGLRRKYSTNAKKVIQDFTPLLAAKGLLTAITKAVE